MKVYVDLEVQLSRAMDRVIGALKTTAPHAGIEIVTAKQDADVVVLHVIGYDDTLAAIEQLQADGQRYALIQYCLRSTQQAFCFKWVPLWREALAVWSYYDLDAAYREDRALATEHGAGAPADWPESLAEAGVKFYLAPLGADPKVFRPWPVPKSGTILTSGYLAASESVIECARAVKAVNGRLFHLGPPLDLGADVEDGLQVVFQHNINDGILSQALSRMKYVAGLRRVEGFELPAVEGLLCGTRPVMFDRPHYRLWFDGLAEFIPEGDADLVTTALQSLFSGPYRAVTKEERDRAVQRFDWHTNTLGFWKAVRPPKPTSLPRINVPRGTLPAGRRVLFIGDHVVSTGFARSAHAYCDGLHRAGWDVNVLGINYFGDPHDKPYRVWPSAPGGDPWGIGRLDELIATLTPAVVIIQNDPWNIPRYLKRLKDVPVVAVMAVDGKNMAQARALNGLAGAIFWTHFGEQQARTSGYCGPAAVVPLGVDTDIYKPQDRTEMRRLTLRPSLRDAFIVGNANRNQPRKRLDLTISYFAQWVREAKVDDAHLYLHVAPTGDAGYDVQQLMGFYGLTNRLILQEPEVGFGISEVSLAATYATWDVQVTTTQGEGWGLTTMEGMACGVPQIVPAWAALKEWPGGTVAQVPPSDIAVTPNYVNVFGAIPDREAWITALDTFYRDEATRTSFANGGLSLVREDRFRWPAIGDAFVETVGAFLAAKGHL